MYSLLTYPVRLLAVCTLIHPALEVSSTVRVAPLSRVATWSYCVPGPLRKRSASAVTVAR